jgi:hypothetical protein
VVAAPLTAVRARSVTGGPADDLDDDGDALIVVRCLLELLRGSLHDSWGARFSTPSALSAPGDREICVEDVDGAALVGASLVSSPSASCSDVDGANPEIWLEPEAICWPPADRRLAILPNVEPWISRSRGAA